MSRLEQDLHLLAQVIELIGYEVWEGAIILVKAIDGRIILGWGDIIVSNDKIIVRSSKLGLVKEFDKLSLDSKKLARLVVYAAILSIDDEEAEDAVKEKWRQASLLARKMYSMVMDALVETALPSLSADGSVL